MNSLNRKCYFVVTPYHLPSGLGDLDEGDREDLEAIERILEALIDRILGSGENDIQGVVLSRAWLTETWGEAKDRKGRARYAWAAALSHQTWPDAWIELFSLMVFDQNDTGLVADYLNKVSQEAKDRIKSSYIRRSHKTRREAILNLSDYLPHLQGNARNNAFSLINALGPRLSRPRTIKERGVLPKTPPAPPHHSPLNTLP